jgi:hypothetical protein
VASERYEIGLRVSFDGEQLAPLVELLVAAITAPASREAARVR